MKKGEIYRGRKHSDAVHPIIFLSEKDEDFFIGAMLTTSSLYKDNILMSKEHFETHNSIGKEYELQFQESHFVKAKLIKKREWAPFTKIGELSAAGLLFVETNIDSTTEQSWEHYRQD